MITCDDYRLIQMSKDDDYRWWLEKTIKKLLQGMITDKHKW